jgi:hypothetical protein
MDAIRVTARTKRPVPTGTAQFDHEGLRPTLGTLAREGLSGVAEHTVDLTRYLASVGSADPDGLSRDEALAFWINVYNACAIKLAVEAYRRGEWTVLRVPGVFSRAELEVAGERLSLNAIEHGKVRRFGDPRIHAALVCGSLSCPTLRPEPYDGDTIADTLELQMTSFVANGGALAGDDDEVLLSRIFLWYGPDFVRPARMPSFVPVSVRRTVKALSPWLPESLRERTEVRFQTYDWRLACEVG